MHRQSNGVGSPVPELLRQLNGLDERDGRQSDASRKLESQTETGRH